MVEIEARPYGPDITKEEREALRARVYMLSDDTLIWHETPIPTTYQVNIFGEKLAELTQEAKEFYLIIDLTEAARPSAEIINCIRNIMQGFSGMHHAAIYTGKNFILNIAAKFVMERVGFASYSIHKTKEEALDEIKNVRK